jgi:putative heme-binding domain-containing protein
VAHLRTSLVDPDAAITPGFTVVSVTLADGKQVSGIRLNENTFSIQIRDNDGRFHSLRKSDLKAVKRDMKSSMPNFKTLSRQELDDLVAYLSSLRGNS